MIPMPAAARADRFRDALGSGPLLLDAAMGTRLIARGLDLSGDDPCLWNLDRPEVVAEIHRRDVLAGADAVTTNTFGANANWLERFGRAGEFERINRAAVAIAREAAGADRFVLGCIGPTAFPMRGEGDWPLARQALLLEDAGVDALILETNAAAGRPEGDILWLPVFCRVPILLSFALVVDDDPLPAIESLEGSGVAAVGWNCIPPDRAVWLPDRLRRPVGLPLLLQPSGPWLGAGPAVEPGPELIGRLVDRGVRLFGGCCGTTERDIAALRAALGPSALRVASG